MMGKTKTQSGFTIVELLIVIVVIGILAAITVVAYSGIQDRARTSTLTSALSQAAKKLAVYQVDNPDLYPVDKTELETLGVKDSGSVTYQYTRTSSTPNTYCITATTGALSYKLANTDTTPQLGGCAGHGVGGVAAITNAVNNPSLELNNSLWQGWSGSGGSLAFSRPTTGGHTGLAFHRATWSVAGTSGGVAYSFPAVAGKTYTTSTWVRSSKAANLYCGWQNGGSTNQNYSLVANTWTRMSCTGTVPVGQSSVQVNSYGFTAVAGDTLDGDDGMAVEGTSLSGYADGNTANWVWNGTVNSSTSTGPSL